MLADARLPGGVIAGRLQTLGNMADAYVKLGEAACKAGAGGAGQEAFQAAEGAYEAACSLCDSASGDDLPGLLYDWGAALFTMAGYAQVGAGPGAPHMYTYYMFA